MFYGAIEIENGNVYYDNIDPKALNDDNIVIVENDFILHYLENDKIKIQNPLFKISSWNKINNTKSNIIVKLLIFEKKTLEIYIIEFLKKRICYIVNKELQKELSMDFNYSIDNNIVKFDILEKIK